MRISDWSSDVCSSDLTVVSAGTSTPHPGTKTTTFTLAPNTGVGGDEIDNSLAFANVFGTGRLRIDKAIAGDGAGEIGRASCRNECVSTCRARWSPYH